MLAKECSLKNINNKGYNSESSIKISGNLEECSLKNINYHLVCYLKNKTIIFVIFILSLWFVIWKIMIDFTNIDKKH